MDCVIAFIEFVFQTNSFMANAQQRVMDQLGSLEGKTVLDLYCGLASLGLPVQPRSNRGGHDRCSRH